MSDIAAIPPAIQTATSAIRRSQENLGKDAVVVANSTSVESRDTIGALVDAREQVLYTRAAVKIINASDEMMKSLLDVRA
jgi:glucosamine 6-phosphate synthetase-like amidotransferase/phosphosugar isomerase protein